MHVKDLDDCELLCYQHDNCVSVNIKNDPDIETGQQECELNNSTHMEHDEHLTVDNAYLYRGAKVINIYIYIYIYRKSVSRFSRGTVLNTLK